MLFFLASLTAVALAQEPASAEALAARVESFHGSRTSMTVAFRQHTWMRAMDRTRSASGTLAILRPGRFRFDYDSGLVTTSDGARVTYYEPGDDTFPGQYYRLETSALGHYVALLTGTASLAGDYIVRLPDRVFGDAPPPGTEVLELVPRAADPSVRRIWLFVSAEGRIDRLSIESPAGDWNRFDFTRHDFDALEASRFDFTPPDGAREISPPRG